MHDDEKDAEPKVVVSIYPLYLIARDIGGPSLPLTLLLEADSDPHMHSLKVSDMRHLRDAALVLLVDPELEHFFHKPVSQNDDAHAPRVLYFSDLSGSAAQEDKHLWLDPLLALKAARGYAEQFSALYPAEATHFATRLAQFEQSVQATIDDLKEGFSVLQGMNYIVDHDAFGAFSNRFGLTVPFVLRETDEDALSAKTWVQAKSHAETSQCLIVDEPSDQANKMSATLDLPLTAIDPLGLQPKADSYVALMQQVASAFKRCLSGSAQ